MNSISPDIFRGVWSATPTPLTHDWRIDSASISRLIEHHIRLGVKGLFVAGTCGEGPWMPDSARRDLLREIVQTNQGRLCIAMQASENSAPRILDNIALAREEGADLVVIAPPYFTRNGTPPNLKKLYLDAIHGSELPVCLYDLGKHRTHSPTLEVLAELYAEPKVIVVKDSSSDPVRRDVALAAKQKRPDLRLLVGDEFNCVEYLQAGYDGVMLGGAAFQGHLAGLIIQAVWHGNIEQANQLQARMNRMMDAVYGGENIECWLSGEKKLLMELGVFETWSNYLNYTLTPSQEASIKAVVENERDVLLP